MLLCDGSPSSARSCSFVRISEAIEYSREGARVLSDLNDGTRLCEQFGRSTVCAGDERASRRRGFEADEGACVVVGREQDPVRCGVEFFHVLSWAQKINAIPQTQLRCLFLPAIWSIAASNPELGFSILTQRQGFQSRSKALASKI